MELTKHNVRLQEVKGDGCRLGIKSPVGALRGSEPVVSYDTNPGSWQGLLTHTRLPLGSSFISRSLTVVSK